MPEDVMIQALHGPYAGQRLTVAAAEAEKAIADGWARDPFAEPQEPKEITDDERHKILEAAGKAAGRLRGGGGGGEETDKTDKAVRRQEETAQDRTTAAMEADKAGEYKTRASKTK